MKNVFVCAAMASLLAICAAASAQEGGADPLLELEAELESEPAGTVPVDPIEESAEVIPTPAPRQTRSRLTDEMVVTAQKREENVQDVPISISAFSGESLDAKGITDAKSLAQSIPGVTYGETVNFSIVYVRGIGTDAFLPDSDLSVANYLDGIYFPFANGLAQTFGAVERVEVLKGPQGTLFGRNATGGAFNITTKSPQFEEPEGSLALGYSRFDQFTSRLYTNVPLTDTLAANISLTYNTGDNYYTGTRGDINDTAGRPLPTETEKGARAKLRWAPTDWLDITVTGLKHQKDGLASSAMPNIAPSAATQALFLATQGRPYEVPPDYVVDIDVPSYFSLDNEVFYGEALMKPEWFDIKLLMSQQDIATDNNYDFDGTRAPFITFDARGQFADVFTAELQFISNGEWGPSWLEWVGGIYYLDQTVGFPLNRLSAGGLDLSTGNIAGIIPIPPALTNLIGSISDAGIPLTDGVSLALVSLQKAESLAYFGQVTANLTDQFYLTLGGRFQEETRRVLESSIGAARVDGLPLTLIQFGRPENDDTNFSPKVVFGYRPIDGQMYYLSWSKGFKSGTFNTVNVYTQPEFVRPEEVTSYELGAKLDFFDGQFRTNAALFYNNIKDQQVQFISLLAGGAVQLENASEVDIYGGEVELQYTPEWNPGFFAGLSATFLDTEYVSYPNASGFTEIGGLYNFRSGDYTGNRTVRTPELSGSFIVNQVFGFERGDLEVGGTYYYSSDFFFQAQNNPISLQPSYSTVDAQISFLHHRSNVRLTLLGKNLTDERFQLTQFHTDAGVQAVLAPPRTVGIRMDWTF